MFLTSESLQSIGRSIFPGFLDLGYFGPIGSEPAGDGKDKQGGSFAVAEKTQMHTLQSETSLLLVLD